MRSRNLLAVAAVAAVLALGGGAYTAYWFAAAASVRDGVAAWAEARRAEGYEIAYDGLAIGGFPFRLVAAVARPAIGRPGHDLAWRWSAEALTAQARPWAVDRIAVALPAAQRVSYRRGGGGERVVTVAVERGVAHVMLDGGALDSVAVEASGIAVEAPRGPVALARLDALARRGPDATVEVSVDARRLTLAPNAGGPLGREIAALAAEATVVGALPEAPLRAALAAWSEAGGTVELESLTLAWGALDLDASGTLALDHALRPQAALTAEIAGYGGALDAFAATGAMTERDASFAKTFLNLLAETRSDGRRVLAVPLTAQDGKLFVGPLPLVALAPVVPG